MTVAAPRDSELRAPEMPAAPPALVPDADAMIAKLAPPPQPGSAVRGVRKLHKLLAALAALPSGPGLDPLERERWLGRLGAWLRKGGDVPNCGDAIDDDPPEQRRLWALVAAFEGFPGLRAAGATLLIGLFEGGGARTLFANMGIPGDRGLFAETADRLAQRLLPQPRDAEHAVIDAVAALFPHKRDPEWLRKIAPDLMERFIRALEPSAMPGDEIAPPALPFRATEPAPDDTGAMALGRVSKLPHAARHGAWTQLRASTFDALLLLASRVSAAGLSDAIRARSPAGKLRESPYFLLPRAIDALLATGRDDSAAIAAEVERCRALVTGCRAVSESVVGRLEAAGVSVDVVYRLELIDRGLARIELLLELCVPQPTAQLGERAVKALGVLLVARSRDRSLLDIVRTNTRLLARKVIERAGTSGEHYITITRREYVGMLVSAAGGGVLTAGTTAAKFLLHALNRPLLQEGLLAGANYAGSFLLMQVLGCTLATKQPSMTAAAIAGAMKEQEGGKSGSSDAMVTTMARLIRSQLAAATGNVLMVIPSSLGVNAWWKWRTGENLLDEKEAHHLLESLSPTKSGTLWFAAITGVILWLSSLIAGWVENWAVYRRIPEGIAEHRARRWVGDRVCRWASRVFARNIAGIGGNLSVGFMLGLTPAIGKFTGLPLDIRHITLSTGAVTMAVCQLGGDALHEGALQSAILGLLCIVSLNLTVSFTLAILLAMRAREVSAWGGVRLLGALIVGFVRSPLRFFFPPAGEQAAADHGHH